MVNGKWWESFFYSLFTIYYLRLLFVFGKRYLLHVEEVQFDRRRAPEDGDDHLERGLVGVDLFHLARERGERAGLDAHRLALRVGELRLGLLGGLRHVVDDLIDLLRRQRRRVLPADEARHLRRRFNQVEDVVGDVPAVVALDLH